ncbi:MAG: hypothetical protein IKU19_00330, partial [Clostridia bacterium]|nr:hypothetical protein [Clostridia bacterium]
MSKFKRALCLLMTVIMLVGMMPTNFVNAAINDTPYLYFYTDDSSTPDGYNYGWADFGNYLVGAFFNKGTLRKTLTEGKPGSGNAYADIFEGTYIKPPSGHVASGLCLVNENNTLKIYTPDTDMTWVTTASGMMIWPVWYKQTHFKFNFESGTVSGLSGTSITITGNGLRYAGVNLDLP